MLALMTGSSAGGNTLAKQPSQITKIHEDQENSGTDLNSDNINNVNFIESDNDQANRQI